MSIGATIGTTLTLVAATLSSEAPTVAAVFPPWWTPASVMAAAADAGQVVGVGRVSSTVILRRDRPGLAARLHAAGALIILDAGLVGGCRPPSSDAAS